MVYKSHEKRQFSTLLRLTTFILQIMKVHLCTSCSCSILSILFISNPHIIFFKKVSQNVSNFLIKFFNLSFQKLETWLEELEINTNRNITKMIVGNKIDLQNQRKVDREMGKKFAKQQRALFVETSAASNINVQMAFEELVKKILEDNIFDDQNGVVKSDIRLTGMTEPNQQSAGGSCTGGYCGR